MLAGELSAAYIPRVLLFGEETFPSFLPTTSLTASSRWVCLSVILCFPESDRRCSTVFVPDQGVSGVDYRGFFTRRGDKVPVWSVHALDSINGSIPDRSFYIRPD